MDNTFDPDAYLAAKAPAQEDTGFDPDAYIAAKANTPSGLPEPQDVDNPPAGAEVPAEQRLANNIQTIGAGYSIPAGIESLGELAGGALNAIPATKNIVPSIGDAANDALLKSIGTSAGQIKQAGKALPIGEALDQARETANVGRQAGLDNVFSTERGRTTGLQNLINQQGQKIGALRNEAGAASPSILDQVKQQLMAKYNPANADVLSGETGDIEKGINTIKNANKPPIGPQNQLSNADIAKGITKLNKYNAGAKALQPVNGLTDVANTSSKLNNAEIAAKLGPEKAAQYQEALKQEAAGFHLAPMIERGLNREAVARVGGKGFLQNALQKAMDAGGYRAASKGLNAVHDVMNTTPQAATTPAIQNLVRYLATQKDEETGQ